MVSLRECEEIAFQKKLMVVIILQVENISH